MSSVPKRYWVILSLSAALNLFCLGVFAAQKVPLRDLFHRDAHGSHERREGGGGGGRKFLRHSGLRDAGPEVQALLQTRREQSRDKTRALGEARAEARRSLQAEPFDAARTRAAFAEVRARTEAMQIEMHGTLSEVASKLTHEQRARLADALWQFGSKGRRDEPHAL